MLPVGTATKDVHGPEALVEICLSNPSPGLGAFTVNVSEAVLPVPALVEVTAELVFGKVPVEAVTLTVTVHVLPARTVPPLKLTPFPLANAVTVPPVQVVAPLGVAVF